MNEGKINGWIARDKDGELYLYYGEKPYKGVTFWLNDCSMFNEIDSKLFPEVSWGDKEPTPVEITITKTKSK